MELNKKQISYFVLILIWMAIVFAFSNQPAEVSSRTSGGITEKVVKLVTKDNKTITQSQRDQIETVIRKFAHFGLYLIGGFLIANFISTTKKLDEHIVIYSLLFTSMYACTDEIHQYFVEGRSCQLTDVIIDACGAIVGIMSLKLYKNIVRRKK